MLGRIFTSFSQYLPRLPGLLNPTLNSPYAVTNQGNLISVRTKMRYHFPHPDERKRVKRHGYWARMATPKGRNVLRRKLLKGKWILGH